MRKIKLNNTEKRIILSFAQEIKQNLSNNIISIKLFGSKARGNFGKNSDIDIFILVKEKNLKTKDIISDIETDYDIKFGLPISTILFSYHEYLKNKELQSFFIENVDKEGILL
jgi:predicted nucleotidyltransferase